MLAFLGLVVLLAVWGCGEPARVAHDSLTGPDSLMVALAEQPLAKAGYVVYRNYGCNLCHGDDGQHGRANRNAKSGEIVPPLTYVAEGYTVPEFKKLIRRGTKFVYQLDTLGIIPPYRMPGWGSTISDSALDNLAAFVWSLYPQGEEEDW